MPAGKKSCIETKVPGASSCHIVLRIKRKSLDDKYSAPASWTNVAGNRSQQIVFSFQAGQLGFEADNSHVIKVIRWYEYGLRKASTQTPQNRLGGAVKLTSRRSEPELRPKMTPIRSRDMASCRSGFELEPIIGSIPTKYMNLPASACTL